MRPPLRMIAAAGALGLAASAPALAAWAPPQPASTGRGDAHSPDVAVNGRGDAAAVWVQEARERGRIVASARSAGGTWSRPAPISPPGMSAIDPQVGIDGTGRVVAVWRQVVRTRVLRGRRPGRLRGPGPRAPARRRLEHRRDPLRRPPEDRAAGAGDRRARRGRRDLALGHRHPGRDARARRRGPGRREAPRARVGPRAPRVEPRGVPPRHPPAERGDRRGRPRGGLVAVRPRGRPERDRRDRPRAVAGRPGGQSAASPSPHRATSSRTSPSSPAARSSR